MCIRDRLRFAEIGVFEGRSFCWLMDWFGLNATGHAVDPAPQENFPLNVARFGNRVHQHASLQDTAAVPGVNDPTLPADGSLSFVYVDGDHSSSAVFDDALTAHHLLKPGGIVAFDDYGHYDSVRKAVDHWWEIDGDKYTRLRSDDVQLWAKKKCPHRREFLRTSDCSG